MLTLFPRIRSNPPAPPLSQPPETPGRTKDFSAPQPQLAVSAGVEAATEQALATTPVAISEAPQAEAKGSTAASQSQLLVATREPISVDGVTQGPGSIDSQLMSVFTEAFVASTTSAAAQKSGAEPFVVEITCIPTAFIATEEAVVTTHQESAFAEPAPSTLTAEPAPLATASVESASAESATASAVASEPVAVSPVQESAAETLPEPAVAQSRPPEGAASPGAEATALSMLAPEVLPGRLTIAATTIFDELDILHEVAESTAAAGESKQSNTEPKAALGAVIETTKEGNREQPIAAPGVKELAGPFLRDDSAAQEPLAAALRPTEVAPEQPAAPSPIQPESQIDPIPSEGSSETVAARETADASLKTPQAPVEVAAKAPQASEKPVAAPRAIALPRKPPRSKASFFELQRIPEPEVMQDSEEVEAYSSAAAQAHLNAIDDTFVARAQLLVNGRERGRALDIGTGPGQIVIKLGARLTRWKFVGIDRSAAMIEKAREGLAEAPEVAGRIEFQIADGNSLDFSDGTFDLVICNSVLHHMVEPQNLFSEIARVVKPGGAILVRDLVRPPRFSYGSHVRKHGKHYQGEMKRLYVASLQAAYTEEELRKMLAASLLRDVRIFRHRKTHIGFERPLAKSALQK